MSTYPCHFDYQLSEDGLAGKTIMVTGASGGIGRAASLAYARAGATVILLSRSEEKLNSVYDQIEEEGCAAPTMIPFDLMSTEPSDYQQIATAIVDNFGHLDGLLHNAGLLGDLTLIEQYPFKNWEKVMQINVNAGFLLTQALLPTLKAASNASLIFTSSSVGRKGRAHWGAYSVSKFATEGLMQVLADELNGTTNIRTNCINPGATRTKMRAEAYPAEDPQTLRPAEEIMGTYLYLMSDDSLQEQGQTFDAQPKK